MELYRWNEIVKESMSATVARQVIHGAKITIARIFLSKGAVVPEHSHENEQMSMLESGKLRFLIGGEEQVVEPGGVVRIPPNAPHRVEAIEDSVAVDIFAPVREDWIRGDDAYLRR